MTKKVYVHQLKLFTFDLLKHKTPDKIQDEVNAFLDDHITQDESCIITEITDNVMFVTIIWQKTKKVKEHTS